MVAAAGASRRTGSLFERKAKVELDPLGVRPILDVSAYKPSRKPVGIYGKERR